MTKPWHAPSDLDPPIAHGMRLGFSSAEIADALGAPHWLVMDRIAVLTSPPSPSVPQKIARPRPREADPRYQAWRRSYDGAKATRHAESANVADHRDRAQ